jgi:hypothetical protein
MGESQQMRSEKQIQASRTNGARSRGPVTAQGKRNSCRNNLRHGFSARDSSLEHDPPAAFVALEAKFMADFQPTTVCEVDLVHTLAVARWRSFLVLEAEKRAVEKAMARQKFQSACPLKRGILAFADALEYSPLQRYQVAFNLQFHRALKRLSALKHCQSRGRIEKNALVVRTQEELESKRTSPDAKPITRVQPTDNLGYSRGSRHFNIYRNPPAHTFPLAAAANSSPTGQVFPNSSLDFLWRTARFLPPKPLNLIR